VAPIYHMFFVNHQNVYILPDFAFHLENLSKFWIIPKYPNYFLFYYKWQLCFVCHAHYTPFTCGKRLLKFENFEKYSEFLKKLIPHLLNYECSLNVGSRLLSSKFFTIKIILLK
jgi:hypothetical protein